MEKGNFMQKMNPTTKKMLVSGSALIILYALFAIVKGDNFLTQINQINILHQVVTYAIVGYGITYVLVGGCGDLSAGSGANAVMRDPAFGYKFLEEFQDKLFFGTDYCCRGQRFILSEFLDEGVETGRISQKAYNKICRENLLALVGE